jgi:hypothetical protein
MEKLLEGYHPGESQPPAQPIHPAKPAPAKSVQPAQQAKPAQSVQQEIKPQAISREPDKLHELQTKLAAAQSRIAELEAECGQLKERLDRLNQKPLKINGWLIVQRKAGGGEYKYWYAGKSMDGKMQWLYLGKELNLTAAKAKIEEKEKENT